MKNSKNKKLSQIWHFWNAYFCKNLKVKISKILILEASFITTFLVGKFQKPCIPTKKFLPRPPEGVPLRREKPPVFHGAGSKLHCPRSG